MDNERPGKKQFREEWNNTSASDWNRECLLQKIPLLTGRNKKKTSVDPSPQIHNTACTDVRMEDKAEDSEEEGDNLRESLEDKPQRSSMPMWPYTGGENYTGLHLLAAVVIRNHEVMESSKIESSTI